jgi:acetyltransferase-like isoleucine patch superfamily enzyme
MDKLTAKIFEYLVAKVKRWPYAIDRDIPLRYFLGYAMNEAIMAVRGFFLFGRRYGLVFVGKNVSVKCKNKLIFDKRGGTHIFSGVTIDALSKEGIRFGKNVHVGKNTNIDCGGTGCGNGLGRGLVVGDNVGLGANAHFGCSGGVEIGSNTIFGGKTDLIAENHVFSDLSMPVSKQGLSRKGIKIGKDCWIGTRVIILDGTVIGNHCVVAAGSVVTGKTFPDNCIIGGVPAKIIKMI